MLNRKGKPQFLISVYFRTHEEGGRSRPFQGDHIPYVLGLGQEVSKSELFTVALTSSETQTYSPGSTYEIPIYVPMYEQYRDQCKEGQEVILCEGSRIVAAGKITRVWNHPTGERISSPGAGAHEL